MSKGVSHARRLFQSTMASCIANDDARASSSPASRTCYDEARRSPALPSSQPSTCLVLRSNAFATRLDQKSAGDWRASSTNKGLDYRSTRAAPYRSVKDHTSHCSRLRLGSQHKARPSQLLNTFHHDGCGLTWTRRSPQLGQLREANRIFVRRRTTTSQTAWHPIAADDESESRSRRLGQRLCR